MDHPSPAGRELWPVPNATLPVVSALLDLVSLRAPVLSRQLTTARGAESVSTLHVSVALHVSGFYQVTTRSRWPSTSASRSSRPAGAIRCGLRR